MEKKMKIDEICLKQWKSTIFIKNGKKGENGKIRMHQWVFNEFQSMNFVNNMWFYIKNEKNLWKSMMNFVKSS